MRPLALGLAVILIGMPLAWAQEGPPNEPAVQEPAQAGEKAPAPHLELSSEEWDFGFRWYGQPCITEIEIRNTGAAPLKILKVKTSCGCTVAKPAKHELGPGEADKITLSYNTKKKKQDVSQTITLLTNDPERPRVAIAIKGEVKEVYEVRPDSRITFKKIDRDETATESVELHNNMDKPIVLRLMPADENAPFEFKLEAVKPGMEYRLSATTKPPLATGANNANVVLETDAEELPSLVVPVSAYIAPRVVVRPAKLYVPEMIKREFQRRIRVDYRADNPIQITGIKTSDPDLIKAELLPAQKPVSPQVAARYHEIQVTLPPADKLPASGGWLEITTDDPAPEYHKLVVEVELRSAVPRSVQPAHDRGSTGDDEEVPE